MLLLLALPVGVCRCDVVVPGAACAGVRCVYVMLVLLVVLADMGMSTCRARFLLAGILAKWFLLQLLLVDCITLLLSLLLQDLLAALALAPSRRAHRATVRPRMPRPKQSPQQYIEWLEEERKEQEKQGVSLFLRRKSLFAKQAQPGLESVGVERAAIVTSMLTGRCGPSLCTWP